MNGGRGPQRLLQPSLSLSLDLAGTMRSTTSEKVQPSFQLLSRW